jgi:hypothetical protein
MMYAPRDGLFFVHIPKCAGTSMRRLLAPLAALPREALAADLGVPVETVPEEGANLAYDHPAIGPIKLDHIPLPLLRDHFPAVWAQFASATSFAIIREPRARFVSALLHRLLEFDKIDVRVVEPDRVTRAAETVCTELAGAGVYAGLTCNHFVRQSDYVDLDGTRRVTRLFALENLNAATRWLGEEFGVGAEEERAERTAIQPRGWFRHVLRYGRPVYRALAPDALRRRLFPIWSRNAALFAPAASAYDDLALPPSVESFIRTHYAADFDLHAETVAGAAPMRAVAADR